MIAGSEDPALDCLEHPVNYGIFSPSTNTSMRAMDAVIALRSNCHFTARVRRVSLVGDVRAEVGRAKDTIGEK